MPGDPHHPVTSLKRLSDGTWQLWCGCRSVFTSETVSRVTHLHSDHIIRNHLDECYGADK